MDLDKATVSEADAFPLVKDMLYKLAHSYRGCGVPIEELFGEASLGFVLAYRTWEIGKGSSFSSWVYTVAQRRLNTMALREKRHKDVARVPDNVEGNERPGMCLEFAGDAGEMMMSALFPPVDVIIEAASLSAAGTRSAQTMRKALRRYYKGEWGRKRTLAGFAAAAEYLGV